MQEIITVLTPAKDITYIRPLREGEELILGVQLGFRVEKHMFPNKQSITYLLVFIHKFYDGTGGEGTVISKEVYNYFMRQANKNWSKDIKTIIKGQQKTVKTKANY